MDQNDSIPIFLSESKIHYTKQPYSKTEQIKPKDSIDLAHANQNKYSYISSSQASFVNHIGFKPDFLDYDQLEKIKKVNLNIGDSRLNQQKLSETYLAYSQQLIKPKNQVFKKIEQNLDYQSNRRITQGNIIVKGDNDIVPNPHLKDNSYLYDYTKQNYQDLQRQKQINASEKNEFSLGLNREQFPPKPPAPQFQSVEKPIVRNYSCVSLGQDDRDFSTTQIESQILFPIDQPQVSPEHKKPHIVFGTQKNDYDTSRPKMVFRNLGKHHILQKHDNIKSLGQDPSYFKSNYQISTQNLQKMNKPKIVQGDRSSQIDINYQSTEPDHYLSESSLHYTQKPLLKNALSSDQLENLKKSHLTIEHKYENPKIEIKKKEIPIMIQKQKKEQPEKTRDIIFYQENERMNDQSTMKRHFVQMKLPSQRKEREIKRYHEQHHHKNN